MKSKESVLIAEEMRRVALCRSKDSYKRGAKKAWQTRLANLAKRRAK